MIYFFCLSMKRFGLFYEIGELNLMYFLFMVEIDEVEDKEISYLYWKYIKDKFF